jgi:hypothetical protein
MAIEPKTIEPKVIAPEGAPQKEKGPAVFRGAREKSCC